MSILSNLTGVHISKKGVKIEPLKAVGTLATLGSFGALGPVAGAVGGLASKIPVVGGLASKIGSVGGLASKIGGMGGGAVGKVGGFLKDNPDALLAGLGAVEGYGEQKKASNLQNEALNMARQQYAERAPLRQIGMQQFQNLQRPDLSGVFNDPGNPYNRRVPRIGGMAR